MKAYILRHSIVLFIIFSNSLGNKGMIKVRKGQKGSVIEKAVIKGRWNGNTYNIIKKIGQGGIGEVYKVKDKNKKIYALKISKDICSITREYDILMKMKSIDFVPNVYEIDDYVGKNSIFYFFIMDYIEGICLNDYFRGIKYNIEKLLKIITTLSIMVENIYRLGYVYVDIKPQNIIISKENKKIFLIDFGGVIEKCCSIKEFTPTYNMVSWRLNFKMKRIENIIFSLSMLMISLISNQEFNPLLVDISKVKYNIETLGIDYSLKQILIKGLNGRYGTFYDFRKDLLNIIDKKMYKLCRNKDKIDIINIVLVFSIIFFIASLTLLRL